MTLFDVFFYVARWVVRRVLRQSYNNSLRYIYSDICQEWSFVNIDKYSPDSQDLIQVALISITGSLDSKCLQDKCERLDPVKDIHKMLKLASKYCDIHKIFDDVNEYIRDQKQQKSFKGIWIDSLDSMLEDLPDTEKSILVADFSDGSGRHFNLTKMTREYINYLDCLTKTEKRVLTYWVEGYSVKLTAEKMHIKSKTVERHRTAIKKVLVKHFNLDNSAMFRIEYPDYT